MKSKTALGIMIICFVITACSSSSKPALQEALEYVPSDVTSVYFTNWKLLKEYNGVEDLDGQSSEDEQLDFLMSGTMDQGIAACEWCSKFRSDKLSWGLDLDWELHIIASGAPIYIMKFREGYDPSTLVDTYFKDFTKEEDGETIILTTTDLRTYLPRINVALFLDENLMVYSGSDKTIAEFVAFVNEDNDSSSRNAGIESMANQLDDVVSAVLFLRERTCPLIKSEQISEDDKAQLTQNLSIHAYEAFGFGYRYEEDELIAQFVFHYADENDAQDDLENRKQLAESGESLRMRRPYSDMFSVPDTFVEDNNLVLQFLPVEHGPRLFFDMLWSRDLLFAACQ